MHAIGEQIHRSIVFEIKGILNGWCSTLPRSKIGGQNIITRGKSHNQQSDLLTFL